MSLLSGRERPGHTQICILGCGPSTGVPMISGYWGDCRAHDPRNHRLRTSVAFGIHGQTWLIDAGPDVRYQCVRENIRHIDGVLCTHGHFDHIGGVEELKPFAYRSMGFPPVPLWADRDTHKILQARCGYAFSGQIQDQHSRIKPGDGGMSAPADCFLAPHLIEGPFSVAQTPVIPFVQGHGPIHSLGFRFPKWAYSTDVMDLDELAFSHLQGLDLWLVDCMSLSPSKGHAYLSLTLSWIQRVRPKLAVLIHMGLKMDYQALTSQLPSGVIAAYDGMRLSIEP